MTLTERLREHVDFVTFCDVEQSPFKAQLLIDDLFEAIKTIEALTNALAIAKQELTFHHIALPVMRSDIIDKALAAHESQLARAVRDAREEATGRREAIAPKRTI